MKAIKEEFSVGDIEETLVSESSLKPNYNAAPSQHIPVVLRGSPNSLQLLRWGLIPFWAKDENIGSKIINARAETILEKPSFKGIFRKGRCIIPADGFFEWKKENSGKKPYFIFLKPGKLMGFAGLWDEWKSTEGKIVRSFAIITTTANSMMKSLHERMPVILKKEKYGRWLEPDVVEQSLLGMLRPFDADEMSLYPVTEKIKIPIAPRGRVLLAIVIFNVHKYPVSFGA